MNQLVGEILSPTGAFLAPAKIFDKLSDGASALYSKIKNTLSSSDFTKNDLVTEGAYVDPIIATAKKEKCVWKVQQTCFFDFPLFYSI